MDLFGKKKIAKLEDKIYDLANSHKSTIAEIKEDQNKLDVEKTKKIYNRARMYYDAAKTDRTRADWGTTLSTPYSNLSSDLTKMISRSRHAYDNDPYMHGAINSIVNNIVCTGIRPKASVTTNNGKPNEIVNKALNEGWKRYNDEYDRRGEMTFYEIQRLALRTIGISGGVLTNTVKADNTNDKLIPIAKQIIEPDRLDKSRDLSTEDIGENTPTKQTLHGINVDLYGKALSYWFQGVEKPIAANRIIHSFIHERPEQYIGVPWASAALEAVWDVHQLNEDTLVKSRALAMYVWWMENSSDPWSQTGDKDSDDNVKVESLSFLKTPNKPEIIKGDDTITESVKPLSQMILQSVFASLGTSYMTVTKDMEGVNFAASRAVIIEERRMYKAIQKWFIKSFCQKEWEDYVWWMVFTDQVPGVTIDRFLRNRHKYLESWWKAEGWAWVDPSKDSKAEIELRNQGLRTDRQILAERGLDLEDHYQGVQEQKEMRKKFDIEDQFAGMQTNLFEQKEDDDEK